ncbi:MAG: glycerophosphodiester phosphodiesterase [Sporichthyaceae bacterium]
MAFNGWGTRRRRFVIAAAVMAASATALAVPDASAGRSGETIAHRGGTYNTPESTLAAFGSALKQKVDGIEFDVQFTRDGMPVVMHDSRVNRTTNCSGYVSTFTWSRLQQCDAGSWFDDAFRGERVPSLHQALSFIEKRSGSAKIFVHVKGPSMRQGKAIVSELRAHNLGRRATVIGSSLTDLATMKRAGAGRLGYVFSNPSGWNSRFPVLIPYNVTVTKGLVNKAERRGQKVYTVEDKPYSERTARSRGVTGVLVDDIPGRYYDGGGSSSGGSSGGGSSAGGGGGNGGGGGGAG